MKVTYRDYETVDYADFEEMVFSLYEEDPEGLPISGEKIRKTVLESAAHPEKLRIVMIFVDGEAAGYAILVFFWSNEYGGNIVHIDELYVKEAYRNQGIATDFIKRRAAAHKDAVALVVETTASNSAAARLYGRLGFEASQNSHLILCLE